jgi:HPt (histidine-containing phosphotransfer) domain-containing protein
MSEPSPTLDPKLAELSDRFRERLPAYRDRLLAAEKRLGTDRTPAPLNLLRQVAHELIGVSGMLGFGAISRAAAALENAAEAALEGRAVPASLRDLVQRLAREIELEL